MNFGLVGDGNIAKYHKAAIEHVGGKLVATEDPKYGFDTKIITTQQIKPLDYIIIASPTYLHRLHILQALEYPYAQIIVEKPMVLPWEMPIDNNRINVVLQLRYLSNLPEKADLISVQFVRDEAYFQSWKGDAKKTGGLFHNLFIHYIDLAQLLNADFEGNVLTEGKQYRRIYKERSLILDLMAIDMQHCYNLLYEDIIAGNGIKPKDLFYLSWTLSRNSEIYGYGKDGIGKLIIIKKELL